MTIEIFLLVQFNCGKNKSPSDYNEDSPEYSDLNIAIPVLDDISLDLNNDSLIDFIFNYKYLQTEDYPSSGMSIVLEVRSCDSNQILYSVQGNTSPLRDSVSIDKSAFWIEYAISLAYINWHQHDGWDSLWSGMWIGDEGQNLGFRIKKQGSFFYGWAKILINATYGQINLVDYACQSQPDLPILTGVHSQ